MKILIRYAVLITIGLISMSTNANEPAAANVDTLNTKQQSIVTIAAFTANGNITGLQQALHKGLDAGLTISEIKEVLVHLYAYAGFPRSLNGLNTFMTVLADRKAKGISDKPGKEASPYPSNKSKYEFGTENLERLIGRSYKSAINDFAPAIDQFLKEHLFGDIFGRDVLDYQTREIVTVAALASMSGTENQLRSHMNTGIYNGLSHDQMHHLVAIIKEKVGAGEGKVANQVLQAIINPAKPAEVANKNSEMMKTNEPFEGAFRKGDKIESKNFSGTVYVNYMVPADSIFNMSLATVTFEPGVRTNWHKHPSGQILVITDGTAYYQEKGKPKQILTKGQVVKCAPGVTHWHGASPQGPMTHLASSPNLEMGQVIWLEKVTDEEYERK